MTEDPVSDASAEAERRGSRMTERSGAASGGRHAQSRVRQDGAGNRPERAARPTSHRNPDRSRETGPSNCRSAKRSRQPAISTSSVAAAVGIACLQIGDCFDDVGDCLLGVGDLQRPRAASMIWRARLASTTRLAGRSSAASMRPVPQAIAPAHHPRRTRRGSDRQASSRNSAGTSFPFQSPTRARRGTTRHSTSGFVAPAAAAAAPLAEVPCGRGHWTTEDRRVYRKRSDPRLVR